MLFVLVAALLGPFNAIAGKQFGLALLGTGAIAAGAVPLPAWARTRARQMEEVAARATLAPGD